MARQNGPRLVLAQSAQTVARSDGGLEPGPWRTTSWADIPHGLSERACSADLLQTGMLAHAERWRRCGAAMTRPVLSRNREGWQPAAVLITWIRPSVTFGGPAGLDAQTYFAGVQDWRADPAGVIRSIIGAELTVAPLRQDEAARLENAATGAATARYGADAGGWDDFKILSWLARAAESAPEALRPWLSLAAGAPELNDLYHGQLFLDEAVEAQPGGAPRKIAGDRVMAPCEPSDPGDNRLWCWTAGAPAIGFRARQAMARAAGREDFTLNVTDEDVAVKRAALRGAGIVPSDRIDQWCASPWERAACRMTAAIHPEAAEVLARSAVLSAALQAARTNGSLDVRRRIEALAPRRAVPDMFDAQGRLARRWVAAMLGQLSTLEHAGAASELMSAVAILTAAADAAPPRQAPQRAALGLTG